MKKLIYILTACALLMACSDDNTPSFDFSGDTEIKSFSLNGTAGVIDHQKGTIVVTLPMDLDVSSLAPAITIADGASVEPASGQAINFTITQTYTVSNGDVYRDYKVSIDQPKAEFTRFAIGSAVGMIDHMAKTIKVYVPIGTDLTALLPVVEYTDGAIMTPVDNTAIDFTNPVQFTLNYYETDFTYTVTVAHAFTIWNGEDVLRNFWKGDDSSSIEIVDNTVADGMNRTLKCLSMTRLKSGVAWSGMGMPDLNIDPSVYSKFSMMVLKNYAGNVQFEVQGDAANQIIKVEFTRENLGKWTELIFELPAGHGFTNITQIVICPHCDDTRNDGAYSDQLMYWDQILGLPQ